MSDNTMTDSQEMIHTEEQNMAEQVANNQAEPITEISVEKECTEGITQIPTTKGEVVARLKELVQNAEHADRIELEQLKQMFYKLHHAEVAEARNAFVEAGGKAEDFHPQPDTYEENFKAQMALIREKRAKIYEEQELQKQENLEKKLAILEKIKTLVGSSEEANKSYDLFKQLQNQWKEIRNVPVEKANELWKNYQLYVEQFYDILKLNNEFRAYDFKKNLEIKTHLCETAEKLADEPDPVSAFHQLQKLHQEYRETGPVAKELRDDIWNRFKIASSIVNKRHQNHFESLKEKEIENLELKTALCEKIEGFELDKLNTFAEWDASTKEIIDIQTEWKSIGFTPKKMNTKIFERFRAACDNFFQKKAEHFKSMRDNMSENLAKKQALCEKAESLKDNTDWNTTGNVFIQMQKDWKTIGPVPKKNAENLWKRFIAACNYFFEQKEKATAGQRTEESENLAKKKSIIEKLSAIVPSEENASQTVRSLIDEWNNIGHVPFKDKDKVYKAYHEQVDKLFKELNINAGKRRLENFKNHLKNKVEKEGNSILRERERLFRSYEAKKAEIQTYENNIGFLSSRSKTGNNLVSEMNNKIEHLKDELNVLRQKIEAIDEQLKAEA